MLCHDRRAYALPLCCLSFWATYCTVYGLIYCDVVAIEGGIDWFLFPFIWQDVNILFGKIFFYSNQQEMQLHWNGYQKKILFPKCSFSLSVLLVFTSLHSITEYCNQRIIPKSITPSSQLNSHLRFQFDVIWNCLSIEEKKRDMALVLLIWTHCS